MYSVIGGLCFCDSIWEPYDVQCYTLGIASLMPGLFPFLLWISCYAVAAVSDGLKAWELLKGTPCVIDLILTEVELPSISGFALLTLTMEHDICRNIPIISMSWTTEWSIQLHLSTLLVDNSGSWINFRVLLPRFAVMSSQDSTTTVYRCMLKGAADYLVKPIRRNELQNLWQHVWRRRAVRNCIIFIDNVVMWFLSRY